MTVDTYISIAIAILSLFGSGLVAYINIVKNQTALKKDIDSAFEKVRNYNQDMEKEINLLHERIDEKYNDFKQIKNEIYGFVNKTDADKVYVKKEVLDPILEQIGKNQQILFDDLKIFQKEIHNSIQKISDTLSSHIEQDFRLQKEIFEELKKINKGK